MGFKTARIYNLLFLRTYLYSIHLIVLNVIIQGLDPGLGTTLATIRSLVFFTICILLQKLNLGPTDIMTLTFR